MDRCQYRQTELLTILVAMVAWIPWIQSLVFSLAGNPQGKFSRICPDLSFWRQGFFACVFSFCAFWGNALYYFVQVVCLYNSLHMCFDVLLWVCARTPQTWAFLGMVLCFVEFCMCAAKFISRQVKSPVAGCSRPSHAPFTLWPCDTHATFRYMYMQYAASLPDQQVPHSVSSAEMLKAGTFEHVFNARDIFKHFMSQLQWTPTNTISSKYCKMMQHAHSIS